MPPAADRNDVLGQLGRALARASRVRRVVEHPRLPPRCGATHILVVHEEFDVVQRARRPRAGGTSDQPWRAAAQSVHQLGEVGAAPASSAPCAVQPDKRTDDDAQHRVRPAFAQHEVRGQVAGVPALAQRWRVGADAVEQITEAGALARGEIGHALTLGRTASSDLLQLAFGTLPYVRCAVAARAGPRSRRSPGRPTARRRPRRGSRRTCQWRSGIHRPRARSRSRTTEPVAATAMSHRRTAGHGSRLGPIIAQMTTSASEAVGGRMPARERQHRPEVPVEQRLQHQIDKAAGQRPVRGPRAPRAGCGS